VCEFSRLERTIAVPRLFSSRSEHITGVAPQVQPTEAQTGPQPHARRALLVLFGLGMTGGNVVGARLADRALMRTIYVALGAEAVVAVIFFFSARDEVTAAVTILVFPFCALAILPALQARIVALAGGAPNVAAASIHAAFNIANSLGAWLGGITIAAGLGYGAPNLVAAGLATLGLGIAFVSGRREQRDPHGPQPRGGGRRS
jgi:MFS transporter, DHA1 family, inner membrane transport protein